MTNDTTLVAEDEFVARLQDSGTREKAFEELVGTYQQRLYWHIRRMVLDHDDTDDVLQNTFIKVFRNIDSFKGESKLYSWMYRIATNEALSFMKQKSRKLGVSSVELQEKMVDQLESDVYYDGEEIQLKLQRALVQLPEKQKLVFNMKYYQNMKYDDISEVLGTSVGALKTSYHHAVKKIEAFLTAE